MRSSIAPLGTILLALLLPVITAAQSVPSADSSVAESAAGSGAESGAESGAGPGAARWRSGDAEGAALVWRDALGASDELSDSERARLAYNLGVAAAAGGESLLATAWFTSALEHAPRHDGAAFNLEIARAEAGLGPRASDDLTGAALGFFGAFTRSESEWFAIAGVLLFALMCAVESLRGGAWTRWALAALLLQPLFFGPLVRHLLEPRGIPVMVVAKGGTTVYSVPVASSVQVGSLDGGDVVHRLDALSGWIKIGFDGEERWVHADDVLPLRWPLEDARELPN